MICKICNFEGKDLTKHILYKHDITSKQYLQKFGELVDNELKEKRQQTRKIKYKFRCPICELSFQTDIGLNNHLKDSKDIAHSHYVYNDKNKDEWVECKICSFRGPTIIRHIQKHGIIVENYKWETRSKIAQKEFDKNRQICSENILKYPCSVCQIKFKSENALHRHLIDSKDLQHNYALYNDTNKNEWVECVICHMRKMSLPMHLKQEHEMTTEYYKDNFNKELYSQVYLENNKICIDNLAKIPKTRAMNFDCTVCDKKFSTQNALDSHIEKSQDKVHSNLIYNDKNKDEWVECQICGFRAKKIDAHLKYRHQLTTEVYTQKYNRQIMSIECKNKVRDNWGDNRQHALDRQQKMHKCAVENCLNLVKGDTRICVSCKLRIAKKFQEEKFEGKIEFVDFVRCKCKLENGEVCNWPDTRISEHITCHNITVQDYKRMYDSPVVCSSTCQKTAFRGTHTEETKDKIRNSHRNKTNNLY